MADRGYAYAELALGVVTDDGLAGIVARDYATLVGQQAGVTITDVEWDIISQELLRSDFNARAAIQNANPSEPAILNSRQIQEYHNSVFANITLPHDAWTANVLLNNSDDPDAVWQNLIDNGGVSPLDNYLDFLNELDTIAAQERINFADQLFISVDGALLPNPTTFGNADWMRENMPASYQVQTLWSAGLISSVLEEWVVDGTAETSVDAINAIQQMIGEVSGTYSDWVNDLINPGLLQMATFATDLAEEWILGNTFGDPLDGIETGFGYLQFNSTVGEADFGNIINNIYIIGGQCHTIIAEMDQSLIWTIQSESDGTLTISSTNPSTDPSDPPGYLGEITIYKADTIVQFGNNYFLAAYDPLVLDLDGDGIETISYTQSNASFDLFGNEDMSADHGWVSSDDGLLAIDRNENGKVDDINELFGDRNTSGFAELRQLDSNGDNTFSALDEQFADVFVWRDFSQDGVSQTGEMFTLEELGIVSISLDTSEAAIIDNQNYITETANFEFENGDVSMVADVSFAVDFRTFEYEFA